MFHHSHTFQDSLSASRDHMLLQSPLSRQNHICAMFLCLLEVPPGPHSVLVKQEPSAALRGVSSLGTDRQVSRTRVPVPRPLPGTGPLHARSCPGLSRKGRALTVAVASAQLCSHGRLVFSSHPRGQSVRHLCQHRSRHQISTGSFQEFPAERRFGNFGGY